MTNGKLYIRYHVIIILIKLKTVYFSSDAPGAAKYVASRGFFLAEYQ